MNLNNSIPKEWTNLILKKLVTKDIKNGYSPNCPEEANGSWILGLGNLTENGFNPSKAKPAPINDRKVKDFLLNSGDFLISRSNTLDKVGRTILFRGEIENCSYPDLLMRFRVDESLILNEYLENYLRSPIVKKYIQSCASGTSLSMVKINKTVVEKIPILLPPLPEQRAIADFLSTWDEAISKSERVIQAKEKRFKWLMQTLISEPQNTHKNTKWKKGKLEDICSIKKGKQLNVVHMQANGEYYALNGGIAPSGRTDDWNTESNTISISEGGNSCGYVNYNKEKFWAGGHCYTLSDLNKSISDKFLFYFLKLNEPKIMNLRVGSGLPNIQKKDIDKFKVRIPPLNEQIKISETLSSAQKEIELLKKQTDKYKIQKCGLMQKMLTGKWRVKTEIVNKYEEL